MKRAIQLVAVIVAVLLTVQPALTDPSSCSQQLHRGNGADTCCTPAVNAAMNQERTHCKGAMLFTAAPSRCNHGECCFASSGQNPQLAPAAKSKAGRIISFVPFDGMSSVAASEPAPWLIRNQGSPGLARYIL